jgi:hypothetical protein
MPGISLHPATSTPNVDLWRQRGLILPPGASRQRFIDPISGIRFYPVPIPGTDEWVALPGVTSILGAMATAEENQRLEEWRQREIAAGRDPNERRECGSRVHGLLECDIRGLPFPVPATEQEEKWRKQDLDFYSGMEVHLRKYETFLWSEKPLVPGWEHCWSAPPGDPTRLARVWSLAWGFSGTPDLIARRINQLLMLGDFKTSKDPYYRCSGDKVPQFKENGFKKYKKTVRQLCAYRLAIKETLGLEIDHLQIIVGLPQPGKAQMFYVHGAELELETENFKKAAIKFWENFEGIVFERVISAQ